MPERNLLAEVLLRAIDDFLKPTGGKKARRRKRDAALRFLQHKGNEIMSMRWICSNLFERGEDVRKRILSDVLNRRIELSRPGRKKSRCPVGKNACRVGSGE